MLNIMTWNVGITESGEQQLGNIVKYIKDFLEKDDSIAFLQQFPYEIRKEGNREISPLYNQLREDFPESDYTIILGNTDFETTCIYMMTVSIIKKQKMSYRVKETDKGFYPQFFQRNREVAISLFYDIDPKPKEKQRLLAILGVHAWAGVDNRTYLNNLNDVDVDIVLGDFNAGNYLGCENRSVFNSTLKGYICICNTVTRVDPNSKKRTCIDHIFVKDELVTKCGNLIVHEDVKYSDHFPVSFTLQL